MKKLCLTLPVLILALLTFGCMGQGASTTTLAAVDTTSTTASVSTLPSIDELSTTTESTSGSADSTTTVTEGTTGITDTTTSTLAGDETTTSGVATETTTGVTAVPGKIYTAQLSGKDIVPAVTTQATGTATFTVDSTGTQMSWELKVSNMTDVIASRAHFGKAGANGSGLVILYPGPARSGVFTGTLSAGIFGGSALVGPLAGKSIADFVDLITSGQAYVNVGTVTHPGGEIRGQLQP